MARRSSVQITKQMAKKIAKKLKATIDSESSSSHDHAMILHEGALVADFGIRRGSRRDAGHDHIIEELQINAHFAKELASCPKSREDWIDAMRDKGVI